MWEDSSTHEDSYLHVTFNDRYSLRWFCFLNEKLVYLNNEEIHNTQKYQTKGKPYVIRVQVVNPTTTLCQIETFKWQLDIVLKGNCNRILYCFIWKRFQNIIQKSINRDTQRYLGQNLTFKDLCFHLPVGSMLPIQAYSSGKILKSEVPGMSTSAFWEDF